MKDISETVFHALTVILDFGAVWLFCAIVSVIILPIILDRIMFYIPKLFLLSRNNEVYYRSVLLTFLEVVLWVCLISGIYVSLYIFLPSIFNLATIGTPAIVAWIIALANIVRRFISFDRIIKRNFYYEIYMRYIRPEALSEYMNFIEELDSLGLDEIKKLSTEPMRYMHKQAVLRKIKEVEMNPH